jgi:hypothetical protein
MSVVIVRSWASRALFSGALCCASAFLYFGCSEDDPVPQGTPDGGDTDVVITPPQDSGSDTGPDAAEVCADTPFDCSATAGDAGVDDAGPDSGNGDVFKNSVHINLRCTSLYSCWSTKKVAPNHREYAPGLVLWSDAAEKTRWVFLPPGQKIDTSSATAASPDGGTVDEWIFPVGTMVYKEFKLAGKRVETRRIWKANDSTWVYSVWRWSADESSATLTESGGLIPNGAIPNHTYEIPSTAVCASCHNGHHDKFLSLDAWSLATPNAKGITLAQLVAEGTLTWPHPTSFALPQDSTGKLDQAVGFYYNNCGFCHKPGMPGGTGGLLLHLPVAQALPGSGGAGVDTGLPDGGAGLIPADTPVVTTAVDVAHTNAVGGMFPLGTYKRITRGNAALSVLPARDSLRDPDGGVIVTGQMPAILQRAADPVGVEATRAWINALP